MGALAVAFSSYLTSQPELLPILRGTLYEGCINFYSSPGTFVMSCISSVYINFRTFSFQVTAPDQLAIKPDLPEMGQLKL